MEGDDVAGLEESILVGDSLGQAGLVDLVGGKECIVSIDFHAEAVGDTGHVASHITEGEDTQFLALELGAGLAVVEITDGEDEQTHDQLGNSIAVLAGGVHGDDAASGAGGEVEVVEAGASADDNLEVLGVVNHFLGDLVGADDEGIGIGNGSVELVDRGIFFEESQGVAVLLNNFADAVDGNFCERLFSSN